MRTKQKRIICETASWIAALVLAVIAVQFGPFIYSWFIEQLVDLLHVFGVNL
jgi:hypothetical protein